MRKRILATLLSAVMILTMLPIALAEGSEPTSGQLPEAECICATVCTEANLNELCAVCKTDYTQCGYTNHAPADDVEAFTACTKTEGCTLAEGHEGDCVLPNSEDGEDNNVPEPSTSVKQAEALIAALPDTENVTLDHAADVFAAQTAYDALSTEDRAAVDSTLAEKLAAILSAVQTLVDEQNQMTAPIPDELPKENATCTYVSTDGSTKSESPVTLSEAVKALNQADGGTITVVSSGLAKGYISVSTPITFALPDTPLIVTLDKPTSTSSMFLLQNGGSLTFGQGDADEDILLTFSGGDWEKSCIVSMDGMYSHSDDTPDIVLYDGVSLEHCLGYTLSGTVVEMHGGAIRSNGTEETPAALGAIYAKNRAVINGGVIENIYTLDTTFSSPIEVEKDIEVTSSGTCVLGGDAIIRNCSGDTAGAVQAKDIEMSGSAQITGCIGDGAGALFANDCVAISGEAKISKCTGTRAGGIVADTVNLSGQAKISGCNIWHGSNSSTDGLAAGGVYSYKQFSMDENAVIEGCTGYIGGGVVIDDYRNRQDTISGNARIQNNKAVKASSSFFKSGLGGGIFLAGGNLTISDDAQITRNSADSGSGGGIYVGTMTTYYRASHYSGFITLEDSAKITDNTAKNGGGIYLSGVFEGRKVTSDRCPAGQLTMNGGQIANNTATENGGGVYVDASIDLVSAASELILGQASLILNNGVIKHNSAVNGAGVCVVGYYEKNSVKTITKPGILYVHGGSIAENTASGNGGGVYIDGHSSSVTDEADLFELEMTGGTIQSNTAANGGGIFANGEDSDLKYQPRLFIQGGSVSQNTAKDTGGGLYLHYLADTLISGDISVDSNTANTAPNVFLGWNGLQGTAPTLEDFQKAYDQGQEAFKTLLLERILVPYYLQLVSEEYDSLTSAELAEAINKTPQLHEELGQYIEDGEYHGTKEQFLTAYENLVIAQFSSDVESYYQAAANGKITLQQIYTIFEAFMTSYKFAAFTVTGALSGTIGVVTEDSFVGRLVAEGGLYKNFSDGGQDGSTPYQLTDSDLAIFRSDNPQYFIDWSAQNDNQFVLATILLTPQDMTAYTGGNSISGDNFPSVRYEITGVNESAIAGLEFTVDGKPCSPIKAGNYWLLSDVENTFTPVVSQKTRAGGAYTDDGLAGEYTIGVENDDTLTVKGADDKQYAVKVADGEDAGILTVRNVSDPEGVLDEDAPLDIAQPVVSSEEEVNTEDGIAMAVIETGATYYTNGKSANLGILGTNSAAPTSGEQIALLFDNILERDAVAGADTIKMMVNHAAESKNYTLVEGQYQFKYLDLINENDGNAWVSTDKPITIFWPYPSEELAANRANYEFTVLHFEGLHRQYQITTENDMQTLIGQSTVVPINVEATDKGVKFTLPANEELGSFSPFALSWTAKSTPPAGTHRVTFQPGDHGTLSGTTTYDVTDGGKVASMPTVTASSNYTFTGWKSSLDNQVYSASQVAGMAITGAVTFTAQYSYTGGGGSEGGGTTRYTLSYASNGGTTYKDERYDRNTVVELDKIPTREGYTFTGWYADKELTEQITEIKMTANKTVYAGWKSTGVPDWLNGKEHFAYVIGYADGTIRPLNNISRAEVATIIFRLLDPEIREANLTTANTFADVNEGMWCNTAISTLARLGIVNGRSTEFFDPDASITRAEFAAICARFDNSGVKADSNFTDIAGHWAEAEIEQAATLGWIRGYADGTFRPNNQITRAEAMTMINRVLQRLPESEDDLLHDMRVWPDNQPEDWFYLAVQEATNSHDFDRKADGVHEHWTEMTADPDWKQYE